MATAYRHRVDRGVLISLKTCRVAGCENSFDRPCIVRREDRGSSNGAREDRSRYIEDDMFLMSFELKKKIEHLHLSALHFIIEAQPCKADVPEFSREQVVQVNVHQTNTLPRPTRQM